MQDGTIWLSQKNMGELFTTSSDNIGLHLKNIFLEGELNAASVTEEFSVTATDGNNYTVRHYNPDAIIAVGYRVNSKRATVFRQWATGVLRDYTLRGYVMDWKRMENGAFLGEESGGDAAHNRRLLGLIAWVRIFGRGLYHHAKPPAILFKSERCIGSRKLTPTRHDTMKPEASKLVAGG